MQTSHTCSAAKWPTFDWYVWYLFSKANISEALLNGVKLLFVQFAGDDVLHHCAVLTVDIPADEHYDDRC